MMSMVHNTNGKPRQTGPNVKRLIILKMSCLAIPDGGGLKDGIKFLSDPNKINSTAKEATKWAFYMINMVKELPDCQYNTDEEIAGAILSKIQELKDNKNI